MGELEVSALAADLRAQQYLAAGFPISKVGRRPVTLDDAKSFVEYGSMESGIPFQILSYIKYRISAGSNHNHSRRLQFFQYLDQPVYARILLRPVRFPAAVNKTQFW
ncbi:hypothetical protein BMS3Bbin11_00502 [bacterium BMS3Bbin11]|nr:hypothetical protein BMS3Bbin11_00502 [bacterium BMS3Bbin11]